RFSMRFDAPPAFNRFFISPKGKREYLPWLGETLETLYRYEPVNRVEHRAQFCGGIQIFIQAAVFRPDFKNHSDHKLPLFENGNTRINGSAIGRRFGQSFKIDAGCDQSFNAGLCDRRGQRFAGAGVRSDAEGEDSPLFSENIESLRVRIG